MRLINLASAIVALTLTLSAKDVSEINASGTISLASNHIWRGMTQTNNSPTLQSTINIDYKGFYLGSALANVKAEGINARIEFDTLLGYTGEAYGLGYDVGVVYYAYPRSAKETNFADIYLGLSKDFEVLKIGMKFYRGVKTNDLEVSNAWETSLSVPLPKNISFEALYGDYTDIGNYYSFGFTKAINDITKVGIAYTGINSNTNHEDNIVAMLSVTF